MGFRTNSTIAAAKIGSAVARHILRRAGQQGPGSLALHLKPDILGDLAPQIRRKTVIVCGTNGKTTTNNLIANCFEASGAHIVCNRTGANMLPGVTTAFIQSSSISGKVSADAACLEIDEASAVRILPYVKPDLMVLTNLFRDQLDRYGEVDLTSRLLLDAIKLAPDMTLLVNADDPLCYSLALESGNRFLTYGIGEKTTEAKPFPTQTRDGAFCRRCGTKLDYDYCQYSQIGRYSCPKCGFSRPEKADYEAMCVRLGEETSFEINGYTIHTNQAGIYPVYNCLAVFAASSFCGISGETICRTIENYRAENGRDEVFPIAGREVRLELAKNPTGFNQNLASMMLRPGDKDVVIVINDNAQDGRDVSWLWDTDFDCLQNETIHGITVTGLRGGDMHLRLKYAGIQADSAPDIETAVRRRLDSGCPSLTVLVNYTALMPTRKILQKLERTMQ